MTWSEFWKWLSTSCVQLAWKLLGAAAVIIVGAFLIKLILKKFPNGSKLRPLDPTVRRFLMSMTKAVGYILIAVSAVAILGVPLASMITVFASAGAAIALALQGSLSNIASGMMLLIFKPLKIGDYIESDGVSGTVNEVGLFYSTLITPDNKRVEIPNSKLTGSTLVNYSTEKNRRVDINFSIDYGSDTARVKDVVTAVLLEHDLVLGDPLPMVRLTEMSESSLDFVARAWCENKDYWTVKFDLTENIKAALDAEGIKIPFPQVDVHVKKD